MVNKIKGLNNAKSSVYKDEDGESSDDEMVVQEQQLGTIESSNSSKIVRKESSGFVNGLVIVVEKNLVSEDYLGEESKDLFI